MREEWLVREVDPASARALDLALALIADRPNGQVTVDPSGPARARLLPAPGSRSRLRPGDPRVGRRGRRGPDGGQGADPSRRRRSRRLRPDPDGERGRHRLGRATWGAACRSSGSRVRDRGRRGGPLGRLPPSAGHPRSRRRRSGEDGGQAAACRHRVGAAAGRRRRHPGGRVRPRATAGARAGHRQSGRSPTWESRRARSQQPTDRSSTVPPGLGSRGFTRSLPPTRRSRHSTASWGWCTAR